MKALNQWLDSLQQAHCPTLSECIEKLGALLPWLHDLEATPQDPQWHSEGNVFIHTEMVLNECYQLLADEAKHIQGPQRQALVLAALLHDIAKPVCTGEREIQGVIRIASPGHECKGRSYLAYRLPQTNLSEQVIQWTLDLVGEHHLPKFLVIKNLSANRYFALARKVPLELLYFLEVADMRGRTCRDRAEQLNIMEEFKMFAQEYGLWQVQNPYEQAAKPLLEQIADLTDEQKHYVYHCGITDYEQGHIHQLEEAVGKTWERRSHFSHAVILCGPSGSGKSTWAGAKFKDYDLVCLDDIRVQINGKRASQKNAGQVMQQAKALWRESLRNKRNVIWDATNLRKDFRTMIADLARDYGALVTLVAFRQSSKTLAKKNAAREHAVPESVLARQLDTTQWPTLDEAHCYMVVNDKGEVVFEG